MVRVVTCAQVSGVHQHGAGLREYKLILDSSVLPEVSKDPNWVSENCGYDHSDVNRLFGGRHLEAFRQRDRVRIHRR